jgi:hypothetical protein
MPPGYWKIVTAEEMHQRAKVKYAALMDHKGCKELSWQLDLDPATGPDKITELLIDLKHQTHFLHERRKREAEFEPPAKKARTLIHTIGAAVWNTSLMYDAKKNALCRVSNLSEGLCTGDLLIECPDAYFFEGRDAEKAKKADAARCAEFQRAKPEAAEKAKDAEMPRGTKRKATAEVGRCDEEEDNVAKEAEKAKKTKEAKEYTVSPEELTCQHALLAEAQAAK